jgi:hypothetical protein
MVCSRTSENVLVLADARQKRFAAAESQQIFVARRRPLRRDARQPFGRQPMDLEPSRFEERQHTRRRAAIAGQQLRRAFEIDALRPGQRLSSSTENALLVAFHVDLEQRDAFHLGQDELIEWQRADVQAAAADLDCILVVPAFVREKHRAHGVAQRDIVQAGVASAVECDVALEEPVGNRWASIPITVPAGPTAPAAVSVSAPMLAPTSMTVSPGFR